MLEMVYLVLRFSEQKYYERNEPAFNGNES
jgi:hypothetical protein